MRDFRKIFSKIFFLTCIPGMISCVKNKITTPAEVYICGYKWSDHKIAVYWKNGNEIQLTADTMETEAKSIFVSGNDVYVCGTMQGNAVYWKNGQVVILDTQKYSTAISIFVEGSDIFVGGQGTDPITKNFAARYWKNGIPHTIEDSAFVNSMAVDGANVYTVGQTYNGPVLWENTYRIKLTTQLNQYTTTMDVAALNRHVYIAGEADGAVCYWKDGTPFELTDHTSYASAYAIALNHDDVYVAGIEGEYIKYWKNGTPVTISDNSRENQVTDMAVSGNDVYVIAYSGGLAKCWKNGVLTTLSSNLTTNIPYGIFVTAP